jgi:hypothetical protein
MSHPARYWNPDKSNKFSIAMVGFVDDSNGQVNSFDSNDTKGDLQNLLAKATSNATVWSQLLDVTGGALEISKCSYHVLYWKFSCQGAPVLVNVDSETQPVQVTVASSGNIHPLEYYLLQLHRKHWVTIKNQRVYKKYNSGHLKRKAIKSPTF